MPFKSKLNLASPIFNKQIRREKFSRVPMDSGNEFRQLLKQAQLDSIPTGKPTTRANGEGFRATTRQSKRGQRPAIQSRFLLNSIRTRRLSPIKVSVTVDAPYGFRLQEELGRLVMTPSDVKKGDLILQRRGNEALNSLL